MPHHCRGVTNAKPGEENGHLESDLGTLIRMLNPHTDGSEGSMSFAPPGLGVPPPTAPIVNPADLAQIQLEIDDKASRWAFKTGTENIERALKVLYRYPLKDTQGNSNGLFATDYLIVGYANGGSTSWP